MKKKILGISALFFITLIGVILFVYTRSTYQRNYRQANWFNYKQPITSRLGNMSWAYTSKDNVVMQQQSIDDIHGRYIRLPLVISKARITKTGKYDFVKEDYAIKLALESGLIPIVTFHTQNHNGNYNAPVDADTNMIKSIIHNTIKRYANKGIVWEAWNEPNGMFWSSDATDWHHYQRWGRIDAYIGKQVHKNDPNSIFIAGNLAGMPTDKNLVKLLKRLKNMGALKYASAISFHPYLSKAKDNGRPEQLLKSDTDRLLKKSGIKLSIVTTEFGYPISQTIHPWQGVWNESEQANYVARSIFIFDMLKQPLVSLYDTAIDNSYSFYNLKERVPRQTQLLVSSLMGNLVGYKLKKRVIYQDKDVYLLVYQKSSQRKLVYWKAHGTESIRVRVLGGYHQLIANETPQIFKQ